MKISYLALAPLLFSTSACFAPKIAVTPRYGDFSVEGDFAADDMGVLASSSFESLGIDGDDTTFSPRADLSWIGMHLSVSALNADYEGTGMIDGTITIDGTTIAAGTPVNSSFEFATLSSALTWDLVPSDAVEVGLGIGVSLVDIDFRIEEIGGAMEEVSTDEVIPIPMLAVRAAFPVGPIGIVGAVNIIDIGVDDADLAVTDLDIYGEYHLFGGDSRTEASAVLGYRSFDVDAQYDDDASEVEASWTIEGLYLGLQFSF